MIAIYSRQSIDKKESISIDSQIEFCKREVFDDTFEIYTDSGYSGKNINRPSFQKLMLNVQQGKISKIIVYRLDRISRSLVDFADFMEILEQYKVSFISATEKFDTSTPMGRAMLYIVVVFAQLERETIATRVQDNYYSRVKQGAWGGGLAPFGFELQRDFIDNKPITILAPTDKLYIVEQIFKLYSQQSTSLSKVQKEIQTLYSTKFSSDNQSISFPTSKLSKILKNPVYVQNDFSIFNYYNSQNINIANPCEEFNGKNACFLIGKNENKTLCIAPHSGIINSEIFLKCQNKLHSNITIKNSGKGKHSWLTGLIKCGYCGYSFSIRTANTNYGIVKYFSCSGKYIHKVCTKKQTHRVANVEKFVEKYLLDLLCKIPFELHNKSACNDNLSITNNTIKNNSVSHKLTELENKIDYLISKLENDDVLDIYIKNKVTKLHEEKQKLLLYKNEQPINTEKTYTYFNRDIWSNLSLELRSEIAKQLISKVLLFKNKIVITTKVIVNQLENDTKLSR